MADLSLSFQELYNEVLKFVGTYNSNSPGVTDLTDAKFIVNRAYARYCTYWDWSFLNQERILLTTAGDYRFSLPPEFSYFVNNVMTFDGDDFYPDVTQRSATEIAALRADVVYQNYPQYFALQPGNYEKGVGQTWDVWMYPTCDAAYLLHYLCKINPQKLVDNADIPIGGPEMADCLLELCLAYAEEYKDERRAVHAEVVNSILGPAKVMDSRRRSGHLGNMRNMSSGWYGGDYNQVHNGSIIIST